MKSTPLQAALAASAIALSPLAASPASAAVLDVEFAGMDVFYGFDGKANIQSGEQAGAFDALDAATFYVDGTHVGTLVGDMHANLGIAGFDDIPADGGTRSNLYGNSYFRVDFDTTDLASGLLNLGIDSAARVDVTYVADRLQLTITGASTGVLDQQPIARLPAWPGFSAGDTVRFTFSSSSLGDLRDDGQALTQFRARGSGTIAQQTQTTPVPEPTGLALLGLGGLAVLRRRRVEAE